MEFGTWIKCHAIFKNISFQDYKFRSFHELSERSNEIQTKHEENQLDFVTRFLEAKKKRFEEREKKKHVFIKNIEVWYFTI